MAAIQEFTTNYKKSITKWCYVRVKKKYGKKFKKHKFDTGRAQVLFLTIIDKFNEIIENMNSFKTETEIRSIITSYNYATNSALSTHSNQTSVQGHAQASDRRLKYDVKIIGKSPSGLNIYQFRYKDLNQYGNHLYQGVMSDEAPKSSVLKDDDGYDLVDYSKIDVDFVQINNM